MDPYWKSSDGEIYHGNVLDVLRELPDESVQMCATSPPYWGLRDYGNEPVQFDDGLYSLGLEPTPGLFIAHMVTIQDEVTGEVKSELDTYKGLRSKIPKLFTEKYVLMKKRSPQGPKHILLTHSTGQFEASSQFASSGNIPDEVEPDLKKLLELAGLPTDDKPITW